MKKRFLLVPLHVFKVTRKYTNGVNVNQGSLINTKMNLWLLSPASSYTTRYKTSERLKLSVVIKVRILAMFCFYSFFSSTPSLSSAWLPLYMLSMSDPAVTTNYLEGLQASLLILTTALFLLKA